MIVCVLPLPAQTNYQKPPKEVLDVLHAPAPPVPVVSPTRTHLLLLERSLYPSVAEVNAPFLRLAGMRINPATNGPHLGMSLKSITIKKLDGGAEIKVAVPPNAKLGMPEFSPDGQRFAVTNTVANGIELYLGSVNSGALKKVPGVMVNDTLGGDMTWLAGSKDLLVKAVPAGRGRPPAQPAAPAGPNIQESSGRSGPVRTYQDMLRSPHDEQLFDYYCTAQLLSVDAASGRAAPLGKPAIYAGAAPAPDGKHILVSRIQKPYSYIHPANAFPRETEVIDRAGRTAYKVANTPLEDKVPIDGVPAGRRNISWRPSEASTLLWWEALDEGDPKKSVEHRDRMLMLKAPFAGEPVEVTRTKHRARGVTHGEGGLVFVSDFDRDRRWVTTMRLFLDDRGAEPKVIFSRNMQDRYRDPGQPVLKPLSTGGAVMLQAGDWIFLRGQGATPQGDRPFLNKMNLRTGETQTIFRAGEKGYESVVALLADDGSKFITSYETPDQPPNLFVRTAGSDARTPLTQFQDPVPQLRQIGRQLVKYKRADGVDLSFTLFLPPGYKEGTRLPTVMWAYPLEYNDADTAGQIGGSTQRYVSMRGSSHLFLLLAGYAVLNDATIPIVGNPETVNDTYVEQLRAGAEAAIHKAAEMGVTDSARVGVSGHSYGGFMTANLLAHTDLFRAGVARSGAYNRTLTPFGFQSERRTYWQARDTYTKMSPFTYADKINEPILLIHGEADNNPGTFPIQSDRLYQAVRGHGGTVRLVMLPGESHGYAGRESIEHTLFEMISWFDRYVKNAPKVSSSR
jgi:dipeptidyl aminopeptidase/acylaminoacyl peptidase